MSLSRSTPLAPEQRTTNGLDTEISVSFYVDPAAGFPAGIHAVVTIPTTSGIPDVIDLLGSTVPRTLSGITAVQATNFLKDCVVAARAAKGYA